MRLTTTRVVGLIAKIYLGALAVFYVAINPIILVFLDRDGILHGLGRLWAIYSPFNLLNWLVFVLCTLPGIGLLILSEKLGGSPSK